MCAPHRGDSRTAMIVSRRIRRVAVGTLVCFVWSATPARAQDMEPKTYAAAPVGGNFVVTSYNWSSGSVLFDPTLPFTDVHAGVQALVVATGHTFGLFGKLGRVSVALPYAWADVTGKIQEQAAATTRSGLADARVKLSVNLRGNPAMLPREFVKAPRRTIVGASIAVSAPAGQYYDMKLINLGTNRWAFKPEVGVAWPKGRWDVDAYAGVSFFTANPDFYPGGSTRTEERLAAIQGHVSYTLRRGLWVAADGTWYSGGRARVNGGDPSLGVNSSRLGVTVSMPVGVRYSLKVSYSSGVWAARTGSDFNTLAVAWQALWLSPRFAGSLTP